MSESSVKTLRITGGKEVFKSGKRRRITTRKVGGSSDTLITRKVGGNSVSSVASIADKAGLPQVAAPTPVNATTPTTASAPTTVSAVPIAKITGGSVKLEPKKIRVILDKNHSRKASVKHVRKFHLDGLHKVIHRAKTIKKKSKEIPIEQVKKELTKHGLYKGGSKAPETMLRQTYADFLTLREKAL